MTVTVKRIGGSVAVVIPKAVAREFDLAAGSEMELAASGEGILLTPRLQSGRVRRPLKDLLAAVKAAHYQRQATAVQDDGPVGREVW